MRSLLLIALVIVQVACARCPVAPIGNDLVPNVPSPGETGPVINEVESVDDCTLVLEKLGKCQRRYVM